MEQEKEEEKKVLVLSPSRIKVFKQCPRKFFYTYHEKLPRKEWEHFDVGTLVHGALEFFHEQYRTDEINVKTNPLMSQSFRKQFDKMQEEENRTLSPKVVLEAKNILKGYLRGIKENGIGAEILSLEQDFELELNKDYNIKGVVDRIDRDKDGIIHIKDYKTNKNHKYMEPFQLQAYGIYAFSKYPDINRFRASYIMLRFDGMPLTYEFNKEDIDKITKTIISYGDKITEEKRWVPRPSRLCDYCDFKDICLNSW